MPTVKNRRSEKPLLVRKPTQRNSEPTKLLNLLVSTFVAFRIPEELDKPKRNTAACRQANFPKHMCLNEPTQHYSLDQERQWEPSVPILCNLLSNPTDHVLFMNLNWNDLQSAWFLRQEEMLMPQTAHNGLETSERKQQATIGDLRKLYGADFAKGFEDDEKIRMCCENCRH
jgi:hypothetical protein